MSEEISVFPIATPSSDQGWEDIAVLTLRVRRRKVPAQVLPRIDAVVLSPLPAIAGTQLRAEVAHSAGNEASLTYQWRRNSSAITGATGASYMPVPADGRAKISCLATLATASGSVTLESEQAEVLLAPTLGSPTIAPAGGPVGTTFTVSLPVDGHPQPELSWQWLAGGAAIAGATAASFTSAAPVANLQARVKARNSAGEVEAVSAGVAVSAPPATDPRGPAAVESWTAGPGDEPGMIYATIDALPNPGDATRREDALGEITGAEIALNGGAWAAIEPLRAAHLPLYVLARISQPETLWQDAAARVPVRDGDPVARIDDPRLNGRFLLTRGQPIYRHLDGRHWLEADGIDDQIDLALNTVRNRNGLTIITAFNCTHAGGSANLFRSTFSSSTLWVRTRVHNGVLNAGGRRRASDALVSHDITGVSATNRELVFASLFDFAKANLKCRVNGAQVLNVAHQTAGRTDDSDASSIDLLQPSFAGRFYGAAVGPLLTARQTAAIEHELAQDMEIML